MIRRTLTGAAILVALLGGADRATAQPTSNLQLCNGGERAYIVAMIRSELVFLQQRWRSIGWFRVEPGLCRSWPTNDQNMQFFLSINEVRDSGRRVLDFGAEALPDWHWDTATYGIERFYCVTDDAYDRSVEDHSHLRQCRPGEYMQLFNLMIFVEHRTSYKLTLR